MYIFIILAGQVNNMLKFSLPIALSLAISVTFGQNYNLSNTYKPLSCKGEIPSDFFKTFSEEFDKDITELRASGDSRKEKKIKEKFYLRVNFDLDNLLNSGYVLFGDTLSTYIQKVGDRVLSSTKLNEKIRFYILKSSEVNAFATDKNIVFVTVGLLSQVENEAQLAYILAHEASHIIFKHSIERYERSVNEKNNVRKGRESYEGLVEKLSDFSQENEFEADRNALKIIKEVGYNEKASVESMYVLKYSHLPFDDVKFNTDYFNTKNFTVADSLFKPIKEETEEEIESGIEYRTHPEIDDRITELRDRLTDKPGKTFLLSESDFNSIQEIARMENLRLNLQSRSLIRVVYEGALLEKKYPNNQYVKDCISKAVYGIAKLKVTGNSDKFDEGLIEDYTEYYKLYQFFYDRLDKDNAMALSVLHLSKASLDDNERKAFIKDLASKFKSKYSITYNDFYDWTPKIDSVNEAIDTTKSLSKVEKLELKNKKEIVETNSFVYAALKESVNDSLTKLVFEEVQAYRDTGDDGVISLDGMSYDERLKFLNKYNKKNKVGIDSLLVLEPTVFYIKNNVKKSLLASEKKKQVFEKNLRTNLSKTNLKIKYISRYGLDTLDISEYNATMLIKETLMEIFDAESDEILPLTKNRLNDLPSAYQGYKNILISGFYSEKETLYEDPTWTLNVVKYIFLAVYNPLTVPAAIATGYGKSRWNYYYLSIYDVENDYTIFIDERVTKGATSSQTQSNVLSHTLSPLK